MGKPLNKEKHNDLTFEDKVIGGGLYFLEFDFLIIVLIFVVVYF